MDTDIYDSNVHENIYLLIPLSDSGYQSTQKAAHRCYSSFVNLSRGTKLVVASTMQSHQGRLGLYGPWELFYKTTTLEYHFGPWKLVFSIIDFSFERRSLQLIWVFPPVISAISDFLLAAYPILILARVRISLRKKIGLCLLMSLGVITGACCVVRLATNWENESPDTTWDSVPNWCVLVV